MKLVTRMTNLAERVAWLAPMVGGHFPALSFWLRNRRDPDHQACATYLGIPFGFRGSDVMALREVLRDREYDFALPSLAGCKAPLVLDIGGHIGTFALWLASAMPQARILSLEADPETFALLAANAESARSHGANWQVLHGAAWHESGARLRFLGTGPSMSHRVSRKGEIEVDGITLADLLNQLAPGQAQIDLMKVDIEGSEEAFLCAEPALLRRIRCVIVELHPALCDAARVRALLSQAYARVEEIGARRSSKPLLLCSQG